MRRILIVPVIATLLLTVAACGSKDDTSTADGPSAKSSESDQTTTTKASSSSDGDTPSDSDTPSVGDLPGIANSDCVAVATLYSSVVAQSLALFGPSASADELEKLTGDIDEAKAKVPDEIKDAFNTWADAWQRFADEMGPALNDGGMLNPANADKVEEASKILDEPDVKAAGDDLQAYFENECGATTSN